MIFITKVKILNQKVHQQVIEELLGQNKNLVLIKETFYLELYFYNLEYEYYKRQKLVSKNIVKDKTKGIIINWYPRVPTEVKGGINVSVKYSSTQDAINEATNLYLKSYTDSLFKEIDIQNLDEKILKPSQIGYKPHELYNFFMKDLKEIYESMKMIIVTQEAYDKLNKMIKKNYNILSLFNIPEKLNKIESATFKSIKLYVPVWLLFYDGFSVLNDRVIIIDCLGNILNKILFNRLPSYDHLVHTARIALTQNKIFSV